MVTEANEKRVTSEKLLKEANGKVGTARAFSIYLSCNLVYFGLDRRVASGSGGTKNAGFNVDSQCSE